MPDWQALERVDFHMHSACSDGVLSPTQLMQLAAQRQVQMLALTDHDSVAGCAEAASACAAHAMVFVPGIELTADWLGREIHIVGLGIASDQSALQAHCAAQLQRRQQRLQQIGLRLQECGLPGVAMTGQINATAPSPTRMHLARQLVAAGHAKDPQHAFDHWLGRGQPGYVPAAWPSVADSVRVIVAAGGHAVLAHAHRYKFSGGGLRSLCAGFREAGGIGIEVSLAGCSPGDVDRAARLARHFDLDGSFGSDFHEPGIPWRPLGRIAKLPDGVRPITSRLCS